MAVVKSNGTLGQHISVELRHIRYFVAAAEHGSFRKASVALAINESAVSRRIRDLEDRIGASLFHRHSSGVSLTLAGQRYLSRARKIIRHIGEGAREVTSIGRSEEGRVRIGILSSVASGFLSDLLRDYGHSHPAIRIDLVDGDPAEHIAAIRRLQLDVAFITGPRDWSDCEAAMLWSERVFAVLPENHKLSGKAVLGWHDLAGNNFVVSEAAPGQEIHEYLVQRLSRLGHHPDIQVQPVGRDNLLPLVALGRGLTLTSEATTAAAFPGIQYRPILGETVSFSAVWWPRNDNPALRRLLNMAKERQRLSPATIPSDR